MMAARAAGLIVAAGLMLSGISTAFANSKLILDAGTIGALAVPTFAGLLSLEKDDREGVQQLLLTYGATLGTTMLLKKTVHSTRPNGNPESFPSGHAASAFAGAAYLQRRYGWAYGAPAYAAALFVGYARVSNDKHHWRDIAGSAVIANVSGYFLTSKYGDPLSVSVTTDPSTHAYGIHAALQF